MSAIEHALLAVMAADGDDAAAAQGHIACAQREARTTARRDRQVVEIAALVVAGDSQRAAGLALEHTAEFPDDVDLLACVAGSSRRGIARSASPTSALKVMGPRPVPRGEHRGPHC